VPDDAEPSLDETFEQFRQVAQHVADYGWSIGAIRIRETPQRNHIAIDIDRLQKDDPILAVSPSEFHAPIRAFIDRVQATLTVYGSGDLDALRKEVVADE